MNKRIGRTGVWIILLVLTAGCGLFSTPSSSPVNAPVPEGNGNNTASPSPSSSPSPTRSVPSPAPSPSPSSEDEIAATVRSMTLEQKIGQMLMAGVRGTRIDADAKRMMAEDHVGGFILFKDNLAGGVRSSVELTNALKKANGANPLPLLISVDQEGGRVSRLPGQFEPMPSNRTVGKTKDPGLAEQMGRLLGTELKLLGINVNFAPVLDIDSNPKNPVIGDRSFGNSAQLVTDMGVAEMTGIRTAGVIPVVKHFPGHGDTAVDSHLELPVVRKTAAELEKMEWAPFQEAVRSGADAVMVAHILFPKIDPDFPASLSKVIIGDQLRGKLGFEGVVFTDDLTMGAIVKNYGIAEAAVRSVEAGSDILLIAHTYETEHRIFQAVLENVKTGRIPETRIDESVIRILQMKKKYGMSDESIAVPDTNKLPNDEIRRWRKALKTH